MSLSIWRRWIAKFSVGPLPAEIVSIIYDVILKSKYQGHEDPWDKVFEQDRFSIMISASGIKYDARDEIVSGQNSPCLSAQSATETLESGSLDYAQAMNFDLHSDDEDERYQDSTRDHLLDVDITRDMSPETPSDAGMERLDNETGDCFPDSKRRHSRSASDDSSRPRKRVCGEDEIDSPERVS